MRRVRSSDKTPGKAWKDGQEVGFVRASKAKVLYDLIRNPFAHSLAVHGEPSIQINIVKGEYRPMIKQTTGLTEEELAAIERSPRHSDLFRLALEQAGDKWTLHVPSFYRDTLHLLRNLVNDHAQMQAAEKRFSNHDLIWRRH